VQRERSRPDAEIVPGPAIDVTPRTRDGKGAGERRVDRDEGDRRSRRGVELDATIRWRDRRARRADGAVGREASAEEIEEHRKEIYCEEEEADPQA